MGHGDRLRDGGRVILATFSSGDYIGTMLGLMVSFRATVGLVLLLTQLQPVAAVILCLYEAQVTAETCASSMGMPAVENGSIHSASRHAPSQALANPPSDRQGCAFAAICAVPAPALARSPVSLAAAVVLLDAGTPHLPLLAPGQPAAPPTQPPRV